jgi:hypothetical protein
MTNEGIEGIEEGEMQVEEFNCPIPIPAKKI